MITAQGLRKVYGQKVAVDDLSFEVNPGHVTGFLGPNGAGKSTTMRLMLGLDNGAGETRFGGRRYTEIKHPMREIGAVLEANAFHPTRSARNHLRMLARANAIPASRADEVLHMVGLTEVAKKQPRGFSLGMGQRLGLAAALLGDPGTLILDEPANGLDPHGIQWLRDVLKSLASEGRSVFVSSHLLAEMSLMADQLVVIGRGQLIDYGPVEGFVSKFTKGTVVVRSPQAERLATLLREKEGVTVEARTSEGEIAVHGSDAATIGELAHQQGVVLHELATQTATLEQAFLSATGESEEYVGTMNMTQGNMPHGGPEGSTHCATSGSG